MRTRSFPEIEFDTVCRNLRAAIDGALANKCVQGFIAAGRYWTEESVRNNPPVWLVFEQGEICGDVGELMAIAVYGTEKRKLGRPKRVRVLRPDDEVSEVFWGVHFSPSHPRRVRQEYRMMLKANLGRDRALVKRATSLSQSKFIESVLAVRGLSSRIRRNTGLTLKDLWRKSRYGPSGKQRNAK